jgi:hypothetical protein
MMPIGTRVRIRKDLKTTETYGSVEVIEDMLVYAGKETKIIWRKDNMYHILLDDGFYYWTDGMFETEWE